MFRNGFEIVFWLCAAIVVYIYVGYPLLLYCLTRKAVPPPVPGARRLPRVTLLISAYNEAAVIGQKIRNALDLDYPSDRLEVLVISDCSTDCTPRSPLAGTRPELMQIIAEDIGEARRHDRLEAVILQRPDGVLARGAAAEVGSGHEDFGLVCAWLIQDEGRVVPPRAEEAVGEPGPADQLEPGGGDDLVGVHVAAIQGDRAAGYLLNACHHRSPGVLKCPATAVAAATAGDTGCVRPPGPCLPSKFLLLVEAERSPGVKMSPFMPRHIEQPGRAPLKTRVGEVAVQALGLGRGLHAGRAWHYKRRGRLGWTLRPRTTSAASRRSSTGRWCMTR